MSGQKNKCVMILDEQLPLGLLANAAAILGITLGKEHPEVVGEDVTDQDGRRHLGIIEFPVPILRASAPDLRHLREKLRDEAYCDVTVVDFSDLAQGCRTYEEFVGKLHRTPERFLQYRGLALWGPLKQVNSLTGQMPLLR